MYGFVSCEIRYFLWDKLGYYCFVGNVFEFILFGIMDFFIKV